MQLTTVDAERDALLGSVDYPLGIIAVTRTLDPIGWMMMRNTRVMAATLRFLSEGRF